MSLINITSKFKGKNIIVLGDIMLDKYIWGSVSRISPEAPVQIVNVERESYVPGGAANVALNAADMGANVSMVGVVGIDDTRNLLIKDLKNKNINTEGIISDKEKTTILKTRVFGRNQQLLRYDHEKKGYIQSETTQKILAFIKKHIDQTDIIIVSDYAKGVITEEIMKELVKFGAESKKMIIVDPKPEHKDFYTNATLLTPNHKEARQMAGLPETLNNREDIEIIGEKLLKYLNSNMLITRGEKGMALFEKSKDPKYIPTFAKEVYDIIGAGDTSVATIALALASGATFEEAAVIANHAAGITVGKIGTSTVSLEELQKSIENSEAQ